MHRLLISLALLLCLCAPLAAQAESPLILRSPTVSRDAVAFVFAGDIWLVGREGGDARRLTTGVGTEATPYFSPDGKLIAFTGEYEGNADVYVVEASGGVPRRLTYHPGADIAQGWTPDGGAVLFRSGRDSATFTPRLFTMPLAGGHPAEIPLPQASEASYSPDGRRLAYVPLLRAFQQWKNYRGGRTTPVWVADLSDSSVEKLPRENSNDFNPMWIGDRVYFLSDRGGTVTIYSYDTRTRRVEQAVKNTGMDIKSASAGDGVIVYEQFGSLHTLDLGSGRTRPLPVRVEGDLPSVRPRFARVGGALRNASLSPSGARALFEARGEIITVPAEKGDARNLTNTPGVAERDPAWSPDGKWVAYFSDESGEYALHLRSQSGMGEVKKISLGNPPSYFYSPVWSPDSKKVTYTDKRLNLWYVDVSKAGAVPVRIDANTYDNPFRVVDPSWSPDSRFIAYTKQLKNRLGTVFIYSLEENKTRQVTDNMSDARFARFDRDGKHLYFTASTNAGPSSGWLDMSSFDRPVTRSAYIVVLRKDLPSPLAPESDEEKVTEEQKTNNPDDKGEPRPGPPQPTPAPLSTSDAADFDAAADVNDAGYLAAPGAEAGAATAQQPPPPGGAGPQGRGGPAGAAKPPEPVRIDFDGIDQRVLALPIPARDYSGLYAGKAGTFFLLEDVTGPEVTGRVLHRFEMSKRRAEKVMDGVNAFDISANGEKMLLGLGGPGGPGGGGGGRWLIVSATLPLRPGEGMINTAALEVRVDPRAEWRQMYRETWRIQRDFFYDPNYHGLDIAAAEKRYEPYLERIGSRADLNYLFQESLGNLVVGHHNAGGGDTPQTQTVQGGLLGADYRIENGRYRFAKVYNGENWNPSTRAPLTQPGVNVKEGEYLLAVNGREVRSTDNIYSFFEGTAGRQTVIKVGPNADGREAREVTVVPVGSEAGLRSLAWVEGNRRKVSELSGGRVAYVYLPNTSGQGYTNFNRYFFAQIDKDAAVIDERFNGGGTAADYFIDYMRRPLMNYWATREGADFSTPVGAIFGPKVMIVDEYAGSGGDALPWYFKREKIGPLVGKRTWGGLVGIYDYPTLMDGGQVTAPRVAFYSPEGGWEVENVGVAPDIEVELDPKAWRQGHDAQLEKAVEVVMQALAKNPRPVHRKPAYPNYYKGAAGR